MRNKCFIFWAVFLLALVVSHGAIQATTYTVNNTNDSGVGSLRQAILDANVTAGTDTIKFSIPSTGPHTIQPTSELPAITDLVIIDGYTQPGAQPNTNPVGQGLNTVLMIELDGSHAGTDVRGLLISAGGSTVRGLVINRFAQDGIYLYGKGGNVIEGNFIGTDISGRGAQGVAFDGVHISDVPNNVIGGTTPEARNLISGNGNNGVCIASSDATGNWVAGNLIGTDVNGTGDLGNLDCGVSIGYDASGNHVGGNPCCASNTIAFNGTEGKMCTGGVRVTSGTGNAILSNSIFSNKGAPNSGLGIELPVNGCGVTPNDAGDSDTGPNNLQNFPVLTSATTTTVQGTLNSTPNTTFILEFFANSECDPSGYGEGETFLDTIWVTTDEYGNVSFTHAFMAPVPAGQFITATATSPDTNTSEFSQCVATTGIQEPASSSIPRVLALSQNQPNPFGRKTVISYQLSAISKVSLEIYDISGTLVRTLMNEIKAPGYYKTSWDGQDENGKEVTSGIYFYRLQAHTGLGTGDYTETKKLLLMR